MRKTLNIIFVFIIAVLLSSCNYNPYTKEEVKTTFSENEDLFNQAVEICLAENLESPLLNWEVNHDSKNFNNISDEDKEVFKKLGNLGFRAVFHKDSTYRGDKRHTVDFTIQHTNEQNLQGIVVLMADNEIDIEVFLGVHLYFHSEFEYEELAENIYYYRGAGDYRVTESGNNQAKKTT